MKFVITTIFAPSEAVLAFNERMPGGLVVVGDLKTPNDWTVDGATYLSPEDDERRLGWSRYAEVAPVNHYARKNLGYLFAMQSGEPIGESDDDNVPYDDYGFPSFEGTFLVHGGSDEDVVNQYSWFTDQPIWPRGLPLRRVLESRRDVTSGSLSAQLVEVGLWQGLADGDPDVDAVYRLTDGSPCTFEKREPFVMLGPAAAPTNSQNTCWSPRLYEAMYLPATVSFRYTDILRGLVASAVANSMGLAVGYTAATVRQDRNPHDYTRDFESEVPVYLTAELAYRTAREVAGQHDDIADKMSAIYAELERIGIVEPRERELLEAWLADVDKARRAA